MFKAIYEFIKRIVIWFAISITDTERDGLSLSRVIFIITMGFAQYAWFLGREIPAFQFYFILINLSYILFTDRTLDILSKVVDMILAFKGVNTITVTSEEAKAKTSSNEEQLNG